MTYNKSVIIFFVLGLIVVGQSAVDLYLPSLPAIVKELHTTDGMVQLTLMTYFIGFAISQLFYGPIADRYGRRPVLLFGLTVFLIGTIACSSATSIQWLLFYRLIQGLGIGAASALSRAIMRDVFHESGDLSKVSSYMAIAWALVPIIAPLVGGYIQHYFNWRANFEFLTIVAIISVVVVYFLLPETNVAHRQTDLSAKIVFSNYLSLLTHRIFMGYILCVLMLYGILVAFNMAGPFLLQVRLGYSPVGYAWLSIFVGSGYLLGAFVNSRVSHKTTLSQRIYFGFICSLITTFVLLGFALFSIMNAMVIVIPMFATYFFLALIYPNCIAAALIPFPKVAGSASALFGFMVFVGGSLSSSLMSHLPETSQLPLALTIAGLLLAAFLSVSILIYLCKGKKTSTC